MSIVLIDGFDIYPNVQTTSNGLQANWALHNGGTLVAGRFGGQAISMDGTLSGSQYIYCPVPTGNTFAVGFAGNIMRFSVGDSPYGFMNLSAEGAQICGIGYNNNQQVYIWTGDASNIVATYSGHISIASWHYYELEMTIGSSGAMNLYIDGLLALAYTGDLGTTSADRLTLGMTTTNINFETWVYDDLYVKNVATREGERRVQTLAPDSDASVQWQTTGANNFGEVNSLPAPAQGSQTGDVYSNAVGALDLYGITSLQGQPTAISAVKVNVCANKDDSGTRTIATALKSGGTQTTGTTQALTETMLYYTQIIETDPNTSAAWTVSGVNNAEIGQEVVS